MREDEIRRYIERDPFSNQLGAKIEALEPGYCRVSLGVTEEMTNFHGVTHGGVVFALADLALAAASNARGQLSVVLNLTITFLGSTLTHERLVAEAREQEANGPMASYELVVCREGSPQAIARAHALVYRKKEWFVEP